MKKIVSLILVLVLSASLACGAAFAADYSVEVTVKDTNIKADSVFNAGGYGSVHIDEVVDDTWMVTSVPKAGLIDKNGSFLFDYKDTWLRYYYDAVSGIVTLSNSNYRTRYTLGSFMDENAVPDAPKFYTLDGKTAFTADCCSGSPMQDGYAVILKENPGPDTDFTLSVIDRTGRTAYTLPDSFADIMGGAGDYYFESFGFISTLTWPGEGLIGYGTYANEDADSYEDFWFDNYTVKGYMDMTGKTAFELNGYSNMGAFSDGLAYVVDAGTGLYGYIDKTGREVIPCRYESAGSFIDGYAYVVQNGLYGYIDKTGKLVIPCEYDAAYGAGSGVFTVGKNGKFGLVDAANKTVVPLAYDDISSCECGAAYAVKNHKVSIITITRDEPSGWAKPEVEEALAAGLVDEKLQKDYTAPVSRADVAQMFVNLIEKTSGMTIDAFLAQKGVEINPDAFSDTSDKAVLACNALGIINGVGNNAFAPDGTFTRGQIAAILNRIAGTVGIDTSGYTHSFTDVAGHWCSAELGWPVQAGIINGIGNNKFDPDGALTTEQAIVLAYRAMNKIAETVSVH